MTRLLKHFIFLLVSVACCYAQKESLVIGPGDLLHIKVLEASELEQSVRVTDSGAIPLIVGGNVKVAGLTPSEADQAIEQALIKGQYLLTPHVSVVIDQPATQNVTVIGQVHAPGSYPISTPRKILDVLALAGGLTDAANRKVTIERHSNSEKIEYFVSNHSIAALDTNVVVYPGDTIVVPKADIIYLLGAFYRPGGIAITTNDSKISLLQASSFAGGTQPTAVPSHARLIRKQPDGTYVNIPIQLSDIQKGKQADIPLQPDDIIYLPFSYLRNAALGISSLLAAASSAAIYQF